MSSLDPERVMLQFHYLPLTHLDSVLWFHLLKDYCLRLGRKTPFYLSVQGESRRLLVGQDLFTWREETRRLS